MKLLQRLEYIFMTPRLFLTTLILTVFAAFGGSLAALTPLPLPYMLGSLIVSAAAALMFGARLPSGYRYPNNLRAVFIALIGVMVGSQVSGEMLAEVPALLPSLAALTLFTFAAHASNYWIFHRLGQYDRTTAFFSGTPGGLLESLAMGEEAGADVRILTMQQFLRIILVIMLVPLGLSLWYGTPLGSAAGVSLTKTEVGLDSIPIALVVGLSGYALGRWLHLPAGQLTGPLLAAAVVTLSGFSTLEQPDWLIHLAQVVIGASLGMRFVGMKPEIILRASWLSLVSVGSMLLIGLALALIVQQISGTDFDILLISYAPGGVTEMALVALSLQANPALVTLHHIYRIFLTVIGMGVCAHWMGLKKR